MCAVKTGGASDSGDSDKKEKAQKGGTAVKVTETTLTDQFVVIHVH